MYRKVWKRKVSTILKERKKSPKYTEKQMENILSWSRKMRSERKSVCFIWWKIIFHIGNTKHNDCQKFWILHRKHGYDPNKNQIDKKNWVWAKNFRVLIYCTVLAWSCQFRLRKKCTTKKHWLCTKRDKSSKCLKGPINWSGLWELNSRILGSAESISAQWWMYS